MNKKNCAVIFACIFISLLIAGCKKSKPAPVVLLKEEVEAVNSNARVASITAPEKDPYLLYKFTDSQKEYIKEMQCDDAGAALRIQININEKNDSNVKISYGFLYKKDFDENGNVKTPLGARKLVQGKKADFKVNKFCLSLCIKKTDEPEGFYFYSTGKASVVSASFTKACIGFENDKVPVYAFGIDGGTVNDIFSCADFTKTVKTFGKNVKVTVTLDKVKLTSDMPQPKVIFQNGDEEFTLRLSECKDFDFYNQTFADGFQTFKFNKESIPYVRKVMAVYGKPSAAITTDLGLILGWPQEKWRNPEYEVFKWNIFPEVLFFDFADYNIQNLFFTRLAYFVEKEGYKGTFVDDEFIQTHHGYNAHDYKADDLARFFRNAEIENVSLNSYEYLLRDILLDNGILAVMPDGTYGEGKGCVISISRESASYLREQLMAHEAWHGIYFSSKEFRNYVKKLYDEFNPRGIEFLKAYWSTAPGLGYDVNDEYLMKNEFMAYLLQLWKGEIAGYFITRSRFSNMKNHTHLTDYVVNSGAADFVRSAELLNDYVFRKWGLNGGRTMLVTRRPLNR